MNQINWKEPITDFVFKEKVIRQNLGNFKSVNKPSHANYYFLDKTNTSTLSISTYYVQLQIFNILHGTKSITVLNHGRIGQFHIRNFDCVNFCHILL